MKEVVTFDGLMEKASMGQRPRVLAHICCGPCAVAPLRKLLGEHADIWGFFHNPNIHPRSEFKKRLESVKELARILSLPVICDEEYSPSAFIKGVREETMTPSGIPPHGGRCAYCYSTRLDATARQAALRGFDAFTSSLLFSMYQGHEQIMEAGIESARKYGILFLYEDFRTLWQEGMDSSRGLGLYMQKYCGCVYSRIERYSKKLKKK